jgi:hypothetical protein
VWLTGLSQSEKLDIYWWTHRWIYKWWKWRKLCHASWLYSSEVSLCCGFHEMWKGEGHEELDHLTSQIIRSFQKWARIALSVWRLSMVWTVQGSNSGGGEIFCTSPDWPWSSPSLLYSGYWGIPQGYSNWGVALTTLPRLLLRLKKKRSCTSAPTASLLDLLWGELFLYLYSKSLQSEGIMTVVDIFFCTYGP